jgi:hypothetical protein
MLDFYDHQDFLIRTDRFPARRTATGDDVMIPGATRFQSHGAGGSQDRSSVAGEIRTTETVRQGGSRSAIVILRRS